MCGIGHDARQGRGAKENSLENQMIAHCAPTLAGLKSACLFSYFYSDAMSVKADLARINGMLNGKGVFAEVLLWRGDFVLLYVYRMSQLRRELTGPDAKELLEEYGYLCDSVEGCLARLKERLYDAPCFPHEIGIFLGYPPEDVKGFIQNGGRNCKCCGIWKVYCNAAEKEALFHKLKKCTKVYREVFASGRNLVQMTVRA